MRRNRAALTLLIANGAALLLMISLLGLLGTTSAGAGRLDTRAGENPTQTADSLDLVRPPATPILESSATVSESPTPTTILELFAPPVGALAVGIESPAATLGSLDSSGVLTWHPGGTFTMAVSMDWGDVDRDGDLDLALGAPNKVHVYLNNGLGGLQEQWSQTITNAPFVEVRWLDLDADAQRDLELVAVGRSEDGTPLGMGGTFFFIDPGQGAAYRYRQSSVQLLRAAPGDYLRGGQMDMVVSSNALNPPFVCPVLLCPFDGLVPRCDSAAQCVSTEATSCLAPADFDGDGDLDVAMGMFQSKEIRVAKNTGTLSPIDTVLVSGGLPHIPYDLSWGDYDRDGFLDLAAAFPTEQEVRIYHSTGITFTHDHTLPTGSAFTPLAVDWGDLDGDGHLELIVADLPPVVYQYDGAAGAFTPAASLPILTGRIQEIRAVDLDADSGLDLAVANQYDLGQLLFVSAPSLGITPTLISTDTAYGLAWGDYDADGWLDLAQAVSGPSGIQLFHNEQDGTFSAGWASSGIGSFPAWGDYDGDGWLDLAVAVSGTKGVNVYHNEGGTFSRVLVDGDAGPQGWAVAWADFDSDYRLDLAVAGAQGVRVYHPGTPFTLAWQGPSASANSVAWADYDRDYYPDLAVAGTQGVQVYHNDGDGTFTAAWSRATGGARTVAWGDYDGDGWPDLAAGYYGAANHVYNNELGSGDFASVWNSGDLLPTTSLAWGDWDNDGDLDLAVGNEGQPDQVYANENGSDLVLAWQAPVALGTAGLAWGDRDRDGDLDLAIAAPGGSVLYENSYVLPAHLGDPYRPLPYNPSYLSVERPGTTSSAYFFSSAEVLADPDTNGQILIDYTLHDAEAEQVSGLQYDFSLDGGGRWIPTTNVSGGGVGATPGGLSQTVAWEARLDGAVSDDALFRITAIHGKRAGPVQRASTSAVSPLFRVQGTSCTWPAGPSAAIDPAVPAVGELVTFVGSLQKGDGLLAFRWNFGDGSDEKVAQQVSHRYSSSGSYTVTLTVTGAACPVTRPVMVKVPIIVTASLSGNPDGKAGWHRLYLPLLLKPGADLIP